MDYESLARHIHGMNEQIATALGDSRESVIAQEIVHAFAGAIADDANAHSGTFNRARWMQMCGFATA
jgi:hypothetical protein